MPDTNPIAAAAVERAEPSPLEGSGMVKDAADLVDKVASGDWTEGLISLVSFAYESKDLLADPLAKLTSIGLGWVIEFFEPLRWLLDQLTGNQEQLNTIVETWSGIAGEMTRAADDLHTSYTTASATWTGPAVARYRLFCADRVDLYRAASAAAQSVADNTRMSGAVLTGVREVVRGLFTDAVGKAISIACRYPPPATPAAAPEIAAVVTDTGNKITQWIGKLTRAFGNAKQLLSQSGNLFRDVKELLKYVPTQAARRSQYLVDLAGSVSIIARGAAKQAVKEIPKQLTEKVAAETVKGTATTAAGMANDQESSELYDGPGPHRITGNL